jgi:hypothetical protein
MKVLLQFLCFWTLSIALFLFKTPNISEIRFCLHLQVEPAQLGPIDRLVPISGQQQQHKIGYINQAQHNPSVRVKTNIKIILKTTHT